MLLERFMSATSTTAQELDAFSARLDAFDQSLSHAETEVDELEARVGVLPGKEEQLARWEEQGIAEQLAEETLFQREHRLIEGAEARLDRIDEVLAALPASLPKSLAIDDDLARSPFVGRLTVATDELAGGREDALAAVALARSEIASRRARVATIRAE